MSSSVLLAPCGTWIWVQETLDKEQSVEWSQILGGEGRGLGQKGCRGRHQGGTGWEQGWGCPQGPGCAPVGGVQAKRGQVCQVLQHRGMLTGGSLAGAQPGPQPLHTHPQGTSEWLPPLLPGSRHSCLAGSQNQQRGQHMPAGLGHRSILLPNSLPLSHLRRCSLIPSAAPRKTPALPAHNHGKSRGTGNKTCASPAVQGSWGTAVTWG